MKGLYCTAIAHLSNISLCDYYDVEECMVTSTTLGKDISGSESHCINLIIKQK